MCGLLAFITKKNNGFSKEQVDAFSDLLYVDALRGMDSTGVFLVEKDGSMDLIKEASAASEFRQHQDYKELMTKAFQRGSALVGHNRAATKGTIIDANAHPFVVDDQITLVHNGTLWGNHKELANTEVDSHAIAHVIHENGDDVEKALQKINGAYALIWHDFKNETINFVRNSQRPLNWVELEEGWIWSSEINMIEWILARYQFKALSKINIQPEGMLTTYKQKNGTWEVNSKAIKLEAPKSYSQQNYYGAQAQRAHPYANAHWCGEDWDPDEAFGAKGNSFPFPRADDVKPNNVRVLQQSPSLVGPASRAKHLGSVERIAAEEQKIARDNKIDVPVITFMNEEHVIRDDTYVAGVCFDHLDINGKGTQGYYLYAKIEGSTAGMIRCYMPPNTPDAQLLDWTLNNRRCLFNLRSREWRCFNNAADGQGFGIFIARSCKEINDVSDDTSKVELEQIGGV